MSLTGAGEDLKGDLDGGPPLRLRALRSMLGYRDCRTSNLTKVMSGPSTNGIRLDPVVFR